ncbi:GNAT family N-acetyltransferase [Ornithinibacillus scapharcae]|uniref:GNAT family N-acetyltransferase n=1 Tax=Ornithinibacillus scapharcae TaxID=1147159 RepID=UPI0005280032|nr:GNAT family N-acetyltransferase [Ornithinibacillus scapharcae]
MDIKIVKYDESYASRVADMWNHSRDGWGGANTVDTEESIINRERNSTNIHTYLALEGEKVVGYCGFSEYRDDEGALYIPLLNVRDDYHGKKIGKKLLLTALEETIHLKWPRLDLYTWSGNTKAVPLYKKCGFFWEDRDDSTHLMNFMPTVLHTEAVADFFQDTSWYDASTREIEVKPDGRVENDFHYYEYKWEKENAELRMEFERTGRGIRLIETKDYIISANIPEHQLVFGDHYPVRYSITNKSSKPLHIDIKGISDKNIRFSLEKSLEVIDSAEVTGTFYIGPIEEEQNSFRTHPTVQSVVTINGKQAVFKVGILPKYPAQVAAYFPEDLSFVGKESVFYLDLKNNFSEKVRFELEFPVSKLMDIQSSKLNIEIDPKNKQSIAIPFVVKAHGYYDAALQVRAIKENGDVVDFTRLIGIPLRGIGASFYGEDEEIIQLFNGQYFTQLKKQGNTIQVGRKKLESSINILTPKIGKPYSEEIAKAKYEEKEFFKESGYVGAKVTYILEAFPNIKVHFILKLYSEGLVEHYYEVENMLDVQTEQPIWINQSIHLGLERAVIPYRGEVVEMNDSIGNMYSNWDDSHITENWLFAKGASDPIGLCWHADEKIHFGSWHNYFEYNLGKIDGNSSSKTNSVYFSIGAFHDAEGLRAFAKQSSLTKKAKTVNQLMLTLSDRNPFVQGETVSLKVTDYKANNLHGEIVLLAANTKESTVAGFNREEQKREWDTNISLKDAPLVSTVKLKANLDAFLVEREALVIQQQNMDMKEEVIRDQGLQAWKINNGIIEIKAAPEFFPAVYSMTYEGHEWLETSYPIVQPKLWWNPWSGGLWSGLSEIRPHTLSKEKTVADFASLTDNKGNEWRGIKLSTTMEKNEEYKGLTIHQYFVLLPGTPVLCHVSKIVQHTGKLLHGEHWQSNAFFRPGADIQDNWMSVQDQHGDWIKVNAGKDENDITIDRNVIIGSNNRREHLHIIANRENTTKEAYINKEILLTGTWEQLTVTADTTYFTVPNFFVFGETVIPESAQHDLQNIRFGNSC